MADLVDRKKLIWLKEKELIEAIKDVLNYCKNKPIKNFKWSILTIELFLEMKGEIIND